MKSTFKKTRASVTRAGQLENSKESRKTEKRTKRSVFSESQTEYDEGSQIQRQNSYLQNFAQRKSSKQSQKDLQIPDLQNVVQDIDTKSLSKDYDADHQKNDTSIHVSIDQIVQQLEKMKSAQKPKSKHEFIEKEKKITKTRKQNHLKQISVGQFYVGRISSRRKMKSKRNFADVEQIYRCQCGRDFVTYMGLYRHVKSHHLKKYELKVFEIRTFHDYEMGKTIKQLSLSKFKHVNGPSEVEVDTINISRTKSDQNQNQSCTIQDIEVPTQGQNFLQDRKILRERKDLVQKSSFQRTSEAGVSPAVSLQKYEKLMQDYLKLMRQHLDSQKSFRQAEQNLRQENLSFYKEKEKHKLKVKFLEQKLKDVAANQQKYCQCHRSEYGNQEENRINNQQDQKSQEVLTQSDNHSMPKFSNSYSYDQSSYDSSIFEVTSLKDSKLTQKKQNKTICNDKSIIGGLRFDPENQSITSIRNPQKFDQSDQITEEIHEQNQNNCKSSKKKVILQADPIKSEVNIWNIKLENID